MRAEKYCMSCGKYRLGCVLHQPNPTKKQRVWRCQICMAAKKKPARVRAAA